MCLQDFISRTFNHNVYPSKQLFCCEILTLFADQKAQKESAGQKPLPIAGAGWSDCAVSLPRQCWKAGLSHHSSAAETLTQEVHPATHPATNMKKQNHLERVGHGNIPKNLPAFLKSSLIVFSTWIIQHPADTLYIIKISNRG